MRIYRVGNIGENFGHPFRAYVGAFRLMSVDTSDRRKARKIVRLARRLGYDGVAFTSNRKVL